MQNGTAMLEDRSAVSFKTKHTHTIWFSNFTPWYSSEGVKSCFHTKSRTWKFIVALLIIVTLRKQTKYPLVGKGINKLYI